MLELAEASCHVIEVDIDAIPVYEETRRLCELLGVDPLGLIASGSLLIACAEPQSDDLLASLAAAGIQAARIGSFLGPLAGRASTAPGEAVRARRHGASFAWPVFEVDEVARILSGGN